MKLGLGDKFAIRQENIDNTQNNENRAQSMNDFQKLFCATKFALLSPSQRM